MTENQFLQEQGERLEKLCEEFGEVIEPVIEDWMRDAFEENDFAINTIGSVVGNVLLEKAFAHFWTASTSDTLVGAESFIDFSITHSLNPYPED